MSWKLSKPGWARRLRNIGVTRLFWDGKRVNGPEAAFYSRQEARDNCAWNTRTYPRVRVTCIYDGDVYGPIRRSKHREIEALGRANQGDREGGPR